MGDQGMDRRRFLATAGAAAAVAALGGCARSSSAAGVAGRECVACSGIGSAPDRLLHARLAEVDVDPDARLRRRARFRRRGAARDPRPDGSLEGAGVPARPSRADEARAGGSRTRRAGSRRVDQPARAGSDQARRRDGRDAPLHRSRERDGDAVRARVRERVPEGDGAQGGARVHRRRPARARRVRSAAQRQRDHRVAWRVHRLADAARADAARRLAERRDAMGCAPYLRRRRAAGSDGRAARQVHPAHAPQGFGAVGDRSEVRAHGHRRGAGEAAGRRARAHRLQGLLQLRVGEALASRDRGAGGRDRAVRDRDGRLPARRRASRRPRRAERRRQCTSRRATPSIAPR